MKNDNNVILFNKTEKLTTSDETEKEHLYSDALVIHKIGKNFLLTIHGDAAIDRYDSVDGHFWDVVGCDYRYKSKGMYKISAIAAKILSNKSPDSIMFKSTLNAIRKRQNLMVVDLNIDGLENAQSIRDSILEKGRELALSKQIEEGICFKQKIAEEKEKISQQKEQLRQQKAIKVAKIFSNFQNSTKNM